MEYTIRINELEEKQGKIKAFVSVTFGESFRVGNISILETKDGRLFVSMPRYKTRQKDERGFDIYKDICNPITREFREKLYGDILRMYEEGKKNL